MFRFTIRDATVVVALAVAWWLDHSALSRRADLWEYRAGAVADWTSGEGWHVDWTPDGVIVSNPGQTEEIEVAGPVADVATK